MTVLVFLSDHETRWIDDLLNTTRVIVIMVDCLVPLFSSCFQDCFNAALVIVYLLDDLLISIMLYEIQQPFVGACVMVFPLCVVSNMV